jgi:hypothetical protein
MSTVEAIKEAIAGLPEGDRVALASWLNLQTLDEWDREMLRDFAPGGKGADLLAKVKAGIRNGKFRPMTESRRKARSLGTE